MFRWRRRKKFISAGSCLKGRGIFFSGSLLPAGLVHLSLALSFFFFFLLQSSISYACTKYPINARSSSWFASETRCPGQTKTNKCMQLLLQSTGVMQWETIQMPRGGSCDFLLSDVDLIPLLLNEPLDHPANLCCQINLSRSGKKKKKTRVTFLPAGDIWSCLSTTGNRPRQALLTPVAPV